MAHVLIVEDEWLIAAQYAAVLRSAGHSIAGPFARVAPALDAIKDQAVDAAFLDISLGSETSRAVARSLDARSIPFAFLTGHASTETLSGFGEIPVLSKPVMERELLTLLGQLVRPG